MSLTSKLQYKPLPEDLTVKPSSIHGLGIFATEDISRDTSLGITHVYSNAFLHSWIRTPLGGFYNHSDNPNCVLQDSFIEEEGKYRPVKVLSTLKDIEEGAEVTCKYTLYSFEVTRQ